MTKDNQQLIKKAMLFAISNHQRVNQTYQKLPYYIHPMNVIIFVMMFKKYLSEDDLVIAICVAWCHDIIEDTGLTYNDIKKELGSRVAQLVCNVTTNIHGINRIERANDDYYKRVSSDDLSIFVKLADRLSNTHFSFNYGNISMYNKYTSELPHFKKKIYNGKFDEMWEMLKNIETVKIDIDNYYSEIETFNDENIHIITLPKPIPYQFFREIYSKGIICKSDLIKNHYYKGKCKNTTVALWNGYEFVYMKDENDISIVDNIKHIEDNNGDDSDLFIPLRLETNPTETQKINY